MLLFPLLYRWRWRWFRNGRLPSDFRAIFGLSLALDRGDDRFINALNYGFLVSHITFLSAAEVCLESAFPWADPE